MNKDIDKNIRPHHQQTNQSRLEQANQVNSNTRHPSAHRSASPSSSSSSSSSRSQSGGSSGPTILNNCRNHPTVMREQSKHEWRDCSQNPDSAKFNANPRNKNKSGRNTNSQRQQQQSNNTSVVRFADQNMSVDEDGTVEYHTANCTMIVQGDTAEVNLTSADGTVITNRHSEFIYDSAASVHTCGYAGLYADGTLKSCDPIYLKSFGSNKVIAITQRGTVKLSSRVSLHGVAFVPGSANLVSGGLIAQSHNFMVEVNGTGAHMYKCNRAHQKQGNAIISFRAIGAMFMMSKNLEKDQFHGAKTIEVSANGAANSIPRKQQASTSSSSHQPTTHTPTTRPVSPSRSTSSSSSSSSSSSPSLSSQFRNDLSAQRNNSGRTQPLAPSVPSVQSASMVSHSDNGDGTVDGAGNYEYCNDNGPHPAQYVMNKQNGLIYVPLNGTGMHTVNHFEYEPGYLTRHGPVHHTANNPSMTYQDYCYTVTPSTGGTMVPSTITPEMLQHNRWGHQGPNRMMDISKHYSLGLKHSRVLDAHGGSVCKCIPCMMGKGKAAPIHDTRPLQYEPTRPNQFVSIDTTGPITTHNDTNHVTRVPSLDGHRYCVLLLDTYSKFITPLFFTHKSEIAAGVEAQVKRMNAAVGTTLAVLHADGGTEFTKLQEFCATVGTRFTTTTTNTPQHNPVERYHGTIWGIAKTLMTQSGIHNSFWPMLVGYATFLHNNIPNDNTGGHTPHFLQHRYHYQSPSC